MRRTIGLLATLVLIGACSDDPDDGTRSDTTTIGGDAGSDTSSAGSTGEPLPAECAPTPYTVVATRDGEQPGGSAAFEVVGSAGLPIPLVPNAGGALSAEQVTAQGATTDLLGYVVFFGDEPFGTADVSMFGGYEPTAAGTARGAISLFPHTTTPLAAGDVISPGALDGLEMVTTLNRVNVDVKFAPDEFTGYLDQIEGTVTILGLNSSSICVQADLTWGYGGGPNPDGTLTVQGIFTAPLAPRTLPFS